MPGTPRRAAPKTRAPRKYARVIESFEATEDGDLALEVGQILIIKTQNTTDGRAVWAGYQREKPQQKGVFPRNCVELLLRKPSETATQAAPAMALPPPQVELQAKLPVTNSASFVATADAAAFGTKLEHAREKKKAKKSKPGTPRRRLKVKNPPGVVHGSEQEPLFSASSVGRTKGSLTAAAADGEFESTLPKRYGRQEGSPEGKVQCKEGELHFHAGDVLTIESQEEPGKGWWTGSLLTVVDGVESSTTGIFPENYVQINVDDPMGTSSTALYDYSGEDVIPSNSNPRRRRSSSKSRRQAIAGDSQPMAAAANGDAYDSCENEQAEDAHTHVHAHGHVADPCPGCRGRLSALRVFLCKSILGGTCVWARRALKIQILRVSLK
jgi:hypothetical protein